MTYKNVILRGGPLDGQIKNCLDVPDLFFWSNPEPLKHIASTVMPVALGSCLKLRYKQSADDPTVYEYCQ